MNFTHIALGIAYAARSSLQREDTYATFRYSSHVHRDDLFVEMKRLDRLCDWADEIVVDLEEMAI